MKIVSVLFFCSALLASGCAVRSSPQQVASTTICEINLEPDTFVGKRILISGVLKTDGRHYTYLVDERCGEVRNAIDIGRGFGSSAYDELNRKWKRECAARGEVGLCVVEALVDVVGAVRRSEDGLVVDVDQIAEGRP